jgi:hypothetical protein
LWISSRRALIGVPASLSIIIAASPAQMSHDVLWLV